jgi:hypothetical protein
MGAFVRALAFLAFALLAGPHALASPSLYAATTGRDLESGDIVAHLYKIKPEQGKTRLIGQIVIDGKKAVSIDGLAAHPRTGVLYAITARDAPEPALLTIDPKTAYATVIGPLGARGSDIHFDAHGTLYMWVVDRGAIGTVDTNTGGVTIRAGKGLATAAAAGGLAIDPSGRALVATGGQTQSINEVDPKTGAVVGHLSLLEGSLMNALYALAYTPSGAMFAVHESQPGGVARELLAIDRRTGNVRHLGKLPDRVDAIAFDVGERRTGKLRLLAIFVGVVVLLQLVAIARWRKRR